MQHLADLATETTNNRSKPQLETRNPSIGRCAVCHEAEEDTRERSSPPVPTRLDCMGSPTGNTRDARHCPLACCNFACGSGRWGGAAPGDNMCVISAARCPGDTRCMISCVYHLLPGACNVAIFESFRRTSCSSLEILISRMSTFRRESAQHGVQGHPEAAHYVT